jgi:hypothetical protein
MLIKSLIGGMASRLRAYNRGHYSKEVHMAEGNSSSNVASVAIVLIVVLAALAFYFMYGRGNGKQDINISVPDKIEITK